MTEFRVLPVRCGDACTIRCRRGDYLFDGGIEGCDLGGMLTRRKFKRLRVAACTSIVRERIGGILDLLEAEYPMGELWLPDGVRELTAAAVGFNGDWAGWVDSAGGHDVGLEPGQRHSHHAGSGGQWWLSGAATLLELGLYACDELPGGVPEPPEAHDGESRLERLLSALVERASMRRRGDSDIQALHAAVAAAFTAGWNDTGLARLCGKLLLAEADRLPGGAERGRKALVTTLALTGMTAALLESTAARVHFFQGMDRFTDRLISGHPVKILNGEPLERWSRHTGKVSPETLLTLVKSTQGNSRSLVYQYGEASCSVLLCGDSRFSFMGRKRPFLLDRPTAALAPFQGGPSAERAYRHIASLAPDRDFWVRGAPMGTRKISNYFKKKSNSLCLEHCQHHAVQEILLRNDGLGWLRLAGCRCSD